MAAYCFETYVSFLEKNRPEAMNIVTHQLLHFVDIASRYGVYLSSICCYPFENFLRQFPRVRILLFVGVILYMLSYLS